MTAIERMEEFQQGARVKHQDGREGIVDCTAGLTVLVALERSTAGKLEPFPVAYLEVIEKAPARHITA